METDVLAPRLARQGQAYVISDEVRVVDPDMRDVPHDGATMGEVVMRGNNAMFGYFRSDEASEEAFRLGGDLVEAPKRGRPRLSSARTCRP